MFELYDFLLIVIGIAVLGVAVLPRFTSDKPISLPIFHIGLGMILFSLPLGLPAPDPIEYETLTEHLTELGVIIALMTAGLKLDRSPNIREWMSTWRLLAITMPVTILAAAVLGWTVGLMIPTAILLGAVIAPTDPVLASEVQVEGPEGSTEDEPKPGEAGKEDEVRFALTSEAGLNDGLAFPFTNLAIAVAVAGLAPSNWFADWFLVDVLFKIGTGLVIGFLAGRVLARIMFSGDVDAPMAKSLLGLEAVAGTLIVYGLTEFLGGYGFIATFIAAITIRQYERQHQQYEPLHDIAEKSEQLLMAAIMILFGGAIVTGLFEPLTLETAAAALALVFIIRPVAGLIGLAGFNRSLRERAIISFFGIRGIGSFYYLSFALGHDVFPQAELIWAIVGLTAFTSILIHGITATPIVEHMLGEKEPS